MWGHHKPKSKVRLEARELHTTKGKAVKFGESYPLKRCFR